MTKQRIVFRADGDNIIGMGHISRCMALAQTVSDYFEIVFAVQSPMEALRKDLEKICHQVIQLQPNDPSKKEFTQELHPYLAGTEIVVLDGYSFDAAYEEAIRSRSAAVITIDDLAQRHFKADAVINFCGRIEYNSSSKEFYTQLLLGLDYVFLRPPFLRDKNSIKKFNYNLLLNMGGSDPHNDTCKILMELLRLNNKYKIQIVIGPGFKFTDSLKQLVKKNTSINLMSCLSSQQMFDIMNGCSMAILPPSTVALEFVSTGGLLFLRQTAPNQACMKKYLLQENLALDYSAFAQYENEVKMRSAFEEAIPCQREKLDGSSLVRIRKVVVNISQSGKLHFRLATEHDVQRCFAWANDPEIRQYSFSKTYIPWETHVSWFFKKITDTGCFFYIVQFEEDQIIGQIRFDLLSDMNGAYQVSYLLDKDWRGKGLASSVLSKGVQQLKKDNNAAQKVVGFVQCANLASVKSFERAGFGKFNAIEYQNSYKFELSL